MFEALNSQNLTFNFRHTVEQHLSTEKCVFRLINSWPVDYRSTNVAIHSLGSSPSSFASSSWQWLDHIVSRIGYKQKSAITYTVVTHNRGVTLFYIEHEFTLHNCSLPNFGWKWYYGRCCLSFTWTNQLGRFNSYWAHTWTCQTWCDNLSKFNLWFVLSRVCPGKVGSK